jgi:hypothetical protein
VIVDLVPKLRRKAQERFDDGILRSTSMDGLVADVSLSILALDTHIALNSIDSSSVLAMARWRSQTGLDEEVGNIEWLVVLNE